MKELKKRAITGVKWNTVRSVVEIILNPITLAVLARLLTPTEYGYIAILTILTGFSRQIARMGFSKAIIQRDEVSKKDLDSVFWFEQFLGLFLALFIFVFAEQISHLVNEPGVEELIKFSTLIFLLEPIDLVFRSLLKKEIGFKPLTKANLVKIICQKCSIIILAVLNFGALSYVLGMVIGIVSLTVVLFYYFYKNELWLPGFYFSFSNLKPFLSFGIFIAL